MEVVTKMIKAELIDKLIKVVTEREQYQRAYNDIGFEAQMDVEGNTLYDCIIKSNDVINDIRNELISDGKEESESITIGDTIYSFRTVI